MRPAKARSTRIPIPCASEAVSAWGPSGYSGSSGVTCATALERYASASSRCELMSLSNDTPNVPARPDAANGTSTSTATGSPAASSRTGGRWAGTLIHRITPASVSKAPTAAVVAERPGTCRAGTAIRIATASPTGADSHDHRLAPHNAKTPPPRLRDARQITAALSSRGSKATQAYEQRQRREPAWIGTHGSD